MSDERRPNRPSQDDDDDDEIDEDRGVREPLPVKPIAPGDGAEHPDRELVEAGV